jgi:hypothetical protein
VLTLCVSVNGDNSGTWRAEGALYWIVWIAILFVGVSVRLIALYKFRHPSYNLSKVKVFSHLFKIPAKKQCCCNAYICALSLQASATSILLVWGLWFSSHTFVHSAYKHQLHQSYWFGVYGLARIHLCTQLTSISYINPISLGFMV